MPLFPNPTFDSLYSDFPDHQDRPEVRNVAGSALPSPYRELLVHSHHMTVMVEEFFGGPVDVKVLQVARKGDCYSRKIVLKLRESGRTVQFGLVRIRLDLLADEVRDAIIGGNVPLGRILIDHQLLREVHPTAYYAAFPPHLMCQWLEMERPQTIYGRLGVILTNDQPTIEVAEILAPIEN
jgi:hypothetical protein